LKGALVTPDQLEALVKVLFRHDAIFSACAMDVAREPNHSIDAHKTHQCEGITKHLTSEHQPQVVEALQALRRVLEGMPRQLYIQSIMMKELVIAVSQLVSMYFAQRRPRELAVFEWTIDAKDPRRITTQEKWWRDTLGPMLDSHYRKDPFPMFDDVAFNYKYFDRSFLTAGDVWYPDRPREFVQGYDIKKMMTERMHFVDSRNEILIQAADILASFLRRLLTGEIVEIDKVARALGRLQIYSQGSGPLQSVRLVTMSRPSGKRSDLKFATMREASRAMIKREPRKSRG
jgi:hypothetical protein